MCPNRSRVLILLHEQAIYENVYENVKILTCLRRFSHVNFCLDDQVRQRTLIRKTQDFDSPDYRTPTFKRLNQSTSSLSRFNENKNFHWILNDFVYFKN